MAEQHITAIDPTKQDPLRRTVKVGRRKVATLDVEQVVELGLCVGMIWDDALAERVGGTNAAAKARKDALKLIERRAITTRDLLERLTRKGHAGHIAEEIVSDLESKGLLDDAAYARTLIESQRASKPAGRRLLQQKLMQKKVPRDIAERALDEADEGYDAVAEARALAEKKLASASLRRADPPTRYRRVYGMLARRGFNPDTIRDAMTGLDALRDDTPPSF